MTRPTKISQDEITQALRDLPGWTLSAGGGKLQAEYRFGGFAEAFSFMARVAFEAEKLDHHPDWSNSYDRVRIELSTHDAEGITANDLELARRISRINWT